MLSIILATVKLVSWTLTVYRELDKLFTQAYKQFLAPTLKIPANLLYFLTSLGGMGLPRLSDRSQLQKWQTLQRCLAVVKDTAASVEGLFTIFH
jgi:hypothetical protein